jgi:hypothetical protein
LAMTTIVGPAFLNSSMNHHCTGLLVQAQSECRAQLLVEFCRRDGARRYPINRGVRCGSIGVCLGASLAARPSENGYRLSLRPLVRAAYDGALLSALLDRGGGCDRGARSVQLLRLPIPRYSPREVGTTAKTSKTCGHQSSREKESRSMRPLAYPVMENPWLRPHFIPGVAPEGVPGIGTGLEVEVLYGASW